MEGEGILGGCKVKREVLEIIKKEFHRKVITIAVFEENQQSEEPGALEQAKHRNMEEGNRKIVNGCISQSHEKNQHGEQSW